MDSNKFEERRQHLQLIARLSCTIPVIAVYHKDETLGVLEVVPAQEYNDNKRSGSS